MFAAELSRSYLDKEAFALGKRGSLRIDHSCFNPMLAAFIADHAAFKAKR